jgi:exosortase A-associated hydrolase 1
MNFRERAVLFPCGDEELVGVLALPAIPKGDVGVIVVVGGPQYRAGSHRQFTLLARDLAAQGVPVLRFDYRGMGDSEGEVRSFEAVDEDICAAIDTFVQDVPRLRRVVLWGLCDGASAAVLYAGTDRRVAGLVLLNPWVRTVAGEARVYLRHYYVRRLLSRDFWRKFLSGRVAVAASLGGVVDMARAARQTGGEGSGEVPASLSDRMVEHLGASELPLLILLSGKDFVAREFESCISASGAWARVLARADVLRFDEANHTFSSRRWRHAVAAHSLQWVLDLSEAIEEARV